MCIDCWLAGSLAGCLAEHFTRITEAELTSGRSPAKAGHSNLELSQRLERSQRSTRAQHWPAGHAGGSAAGTSGRPAAPPADCYHVSSRPWHEFLSGTMTSTDSCPAESQDRRLCCEVSNSASGWNAASGAPEPSTGPLAMPGGQRRGPAVGRPPLLPTVIMFPAGHGMSFFLER